MRKQYKVDEFRVNPESNQIVSGQNIYSLEPQTMAVLVVLLERRGEVILRDELIELAWKGAVVGDSSVNRTIAQLRKVFNDSAKQPIYIETIPKKGYRFKLEVNQCSVKTQDRGLIKPKVYLLLGILLTIGATIWYQSDHSNQQSDAKKILPVSQLTSEIGREKHPSFSTDKKYMVYITLDENREKTSVSLKSLKSGHTWRIHGDVEQKFLSPIFTLDSDTVTFISVKRNDCSIQSIAINNLIEGKLKTKSIAPCHSNYPPSMIRWKSNSNLLIAEKLAKHSPYQINELNLTTKTKRQLSFPKSNSWGDRVFDYNTTQKTLAFVRWSPSVQAVYLIDTTTGYRYEVPIKKAAIKGVSLNPSGNKLLLSWSHQLGIYDLRSKALNIILNQRNISEAMFAASDRSIAVAAHKMRSHIWEKALDSKQPPQKITQSDAIDSSAIYLDGINRIAFISDRSGRNQIWTINQSGQDLKMVSQFKDSLKLSSISWSKQNEKLIAWDSNRNQIWQVNIESSDSELLFSSESKIVLPQYSSQGQFITFGSLKSGDWEIWGINYKGEQLHRMTFSGGYFGKFIEERQTLFFTRYNDKGVWKRQMLLGESQQILMAQATDDYPWWEIDTENLYILQSKSEAHGIYRFSIQGTNSTLLQTLDKKHSGRFDINHSRTNLLYNHYQSSDGEIWIFE
jgi:DNA-binding winged helix-turn-helix (wHTH) protein/Tol biopolymer transport system component